LPDIGLQTQTTTFTTTELQEAIFTDFGMKSSITQMDLRPLLIFALREFLWDLLPTISPIQTEDSVLDHLFLPLDKIHAVHMLMTINLILTSQIHQ
jgi:hypothetical protein